jgi:hypothetical protein
MPKKKNKKSKTKDYSEVSLTWRGDISSIHGHSQHARSILLPLIQGGASVRLENVNMFSKPQADLDEWWIDKLQNAQRVPPGIIKINHGDPKHSSPNESGGKNIIYTRWDTWKVPRGWINSINSHDECWTTNEFSLTEERSPEITVPKKAIPYGINFDRYNSFNDKAKIVEVPKDHIILGTTASWNNKENLTDLIVAFCSEFFKGVDPVTLVIKIDSPGPNDPNQLQRVNNLVREAKNMVDKPDKPNIIVLQDNFTQYAMDKLINCFDIYVSAARSKSKNISMLKAIAMKKQCVGVFTGIHSDYFTGLEQGKSLFPVNFVLEPCVKMKEMYSSMDLWPRPDVGHLMFQMRNAVREFYSPARKHLVEEVSNSLKNRYDITKIVDEIASYTSVKTEVASELVL